MNDLNLKDLSVFGLCDKQLACHSCRVNFKKNYSQLPPITEDEQDVLDELGSNLCKRGETRMSCQLKVTKELEGCEIEIPRSAFAFFEKMTNDDNK